MRQGFTVFLIAGLFAGCSSQPATTVNNKVARPSSNSWTVPAANTATNSNAESLNSNRTLTRAEIMEKMRQKSLVNTPSSGPLPTPQFHPAPENSAIATTMNKDGAVVATRIFKNDPQLAKVEMTWVGPKDGTLKIFLKNGRIVERKSDNIENLGSTPMSVFLEMAGLKASR